MGEDAERPMAVCGESCVANKVVTALQVLHLSRRLGQRLSEDIEAVPDLSHCNVKNESSELGFAVVALGFVPDRRTVLSHRAAYLANKRTNVPFRPFNQIGGHLAVRFFLNSARSLCAHQRKS